MIGLEWRGFRLGDLEGGDDPSSDESPVLGVLGTGVGVTGLGTAPRTTVLTPSPTGGDVPGPSQSRAATIRVDQLRTTNRDHLLRFIGSMAELPPDAEEPLLLHNLLWPGTVQVWARPEACEPVVNALSLGVGEWRANGTVWTAADPTVYAADPDVIDATPASTQTLTFTNDGTRSTQNGRAWTATITAVGSPVVSPYVELDGHRVTWAGLTIPTGDTLTIGADRHTYLEGVGVDGYRWSGGSPDPDWPITEPGDNVFTFGRASGGTIDAELTARSTW